MRSNPPGANPNGSELLDVHAAIRQQFGNARRILILSHIRPDGDAVGSLLGLGLALIDVGKDVRMVLVDGLPLTFRYLEGSSLIHRGTGDLNLYDYVIVVDCSDLQRAGSTQSGTHVLNGRVPDLNIDHHITNLKYAKTNLVVGEQVATCAILAEYLPEWGLSYNKAIAGALLTGIVTDTLGFRTSNMTPEALRLSAVLMEHGANLPDLYSRALISKTFEAARYWARGLERMQREDHLVYTSLTLEDRQAAQYPGNDDADLINLLSSIDIEIAIIFVEQKNEHVKISWRAQPGIDVSKIALQFGGGGHAAAAGADVPGKLEEVQQKVLEATRAVFTNEVAADKGQKSD